MGLYLIKGGKKVETRTEVTLSTRISDHHVDVEKDQDGNPLVIAVVMKYLNIMMLILIKFV